MRSKVTGDKLHAAEDHSGLSRSARNGHHVRDLKEAIGISVQLEVAAAQHVGADGLGRVLRREAQGGLDVDFGAAPHGYHVAVKRLAVACADVVDVGLLLLLEGCKALGAHEDDVRELTGGVPNLTVNHELIEVRQVKACTRIKEVVEPVLCLVGSLAQAAHTVLLVCSGNTLEPAGASCSGHAVQGLQGGEAGAVTNHDLLADLFLEAKHDVLHLAFEDVDHSQVTLVGSLFHCAQDDGLGEVRVLELGSLEGVRDCHAHRLKAVAELGDAGVLTEDDRLLYAQTARDFDEVAGLLDCTKQGVTEKAVVNELVTQQLQRGADY